MTQPLKHLMARRQGSRGTEVLRACWLLALLVALPAASARAASTWTVPGQFATIQAALSSASVAAGDTIVVADSPTGGYTGAGFVNIDFGGKNVTVQSLHGAAACVINCAGARAFYFHSGENGNAVVRGFTLQGGSGDHGGAILVYDPDGATLTSPTLDACVFSGGAAQMGGAVYLDNSSSVISRCLFSGNRATGGSAAIQNVGGALEILGTVAVTPIIVNSVFAGNSAAGDGGAIDISGNGSHIPSVSVINDTFSGNAATGAGQTVSAGHQPGALSGMGGAVAVTNCILYGDTAPVELSTLNASPGLTVQFSDVQGGYAGANNINATPLFLNASAGNFHLQAGSPALGAGTHTGAPPTDKDGLTRPALPSQGAYELPPSHASLLWDNVSGQAALWTVNPDGSYASALYGPFTGWTARAVSEAPDGANWLLWTNTNGEASLWRVYSLTANGYSTIQYGPYPGYAAVSLSIGSDGNPRLLWNETSGVASLWDVNKATGAFTHAEYGPFSGYTANQVSSGATVTDLLWTNTNGTAAGWRIAADGTLNTSAFGPFSGYSCVSLSVGPDDGAHLLWDSTSGTEALWSADFSTGAYTDANYGPFSGYAASAIAVGPDNATRLLWNNTNGTASLWDIIGSNYTHTEYGPFSGWTAVGVSAGP